MDEPLGNIELVKCWGGHGRRPPTDRGTRKSGLIGKRPLGKGADPDSSGRVTERQRRVSETYGKKKKGDAPKRVARKRVVKVGARLELHFHSSASSFCRHRAWGAKSGCEKNEVGYR